MHRKIIIALIKWLENTVKMSLSLTILRLESFVETGVRGLENELFSPFHCFEFMCLLFCKFCVFYLK